MLSDLDLLQLPSLMVSVPSVLANGKVNIALQRDNRIVEFQCDAQYIQTVNSAPVSALCVSHLLSKIQNRCASDEEFSKRRQELLVLLSNNLN
jgi:cell division protein ZapA (FtsZ GTPase activity inhibitor)